MKKTLFICLAVTLFGCKTIKVPYFDKMSPDEICGGVPEYCQPTGSVNWAKVKPGKDFNNNISEVLGRKFKNVYETEKCVSKPPELSDVDISGVTTIAGKISKKQNRTFKADLKSDLKELINSSLIDFSDSLNLDIDYIIETNISKKSLSKYKS